MIDCKTKTDEEIIDLYKSFETVENRDKVKETVMRLIGEMFENIEGEYKARGLDKKKEDAVHVGDIFKEYLRDPKNTHHIRVCKVDEIGEDGSMMCDETIYTLYHGRGRYGKSEQRSYGVPFCKRDTMVKISEEEAAKQKECFDNFDIKGVIDLNDKAFAAKEAKKSENNGEKKGDKCRCHGRHSTEHSNNDKHYPCGCEVKCDDSKKAANPYVSPNTWLWDILGNIVAINGGVARN